MRKKKVKKIWRIRMEWIIFLIAFFSVIALPVVLKLTPLIVFGLWIVYDWNKDYYLEVRKK